MKAANILSMTIKDVEATDWAKMSKQQLEGILKNLNESASLSELRIVQKVKAEVEKALQDK